MRVSQLLIVIFLGIPNYEKSPWLMDPFLINLYISFTLECLLLADSFYRSSLRERPENLRNPLAVFRFAYLQIEGLPLTSDVHGIACSVWRLLSAASSSREREGSTVCL
jgi:hypothetical protein